MSNNNIQIDGLDELFSQLDKINISDTVRKEAIGEAADIYGNILISNTPVSDKDKKNHLRDDVTYKKNQYPDGSVDVGFSKYGWYYRFVNNGTKSMPGKHFMEHSLDEAQPKMQEAIINRIMEGD
ncbi:HK97-gp10 family putative phage morphogenesis protein [Sporolactobacillus putidus]|uniref:Phage protein, HK97 gp10 family n=1 Tax=Sporolactobacillus putidus TaxID=492735 RepID=A0A917S3V9_9BACL|nr:HK97-gp10 family putative phage morphogenesis protein [Sporolactobacillus putidus]GGL55886.1 hypothetical protein GCM10007968_20010 [Sporolactobacillus putidus]